MTFFSYNRVQNKAKPDRKAGTESYGSTFHTVEKDRRVTKTNIILEFFMFFLLKRTLIALLLTLSLQANDTKTYTKVMELGLREVSAIPAMMKDYVMVEMKNTFSDPTADLKNEIAYFKSFQEKLSTLATDDETKKAISEHQAMWEKLETVLQKPITKEGFKEVKKYATPLRASIKKMIRSTKEKLHNETSDRLYYTGKLSAVSQKFASLYMLLKWGMDNEKLHKDMVKQKEMFSNALAELKKMSLSDEKTKKVLGELEKDLQYFEFLENSTKTFMPALVYKKTNIMFEHTNEMMAALLKK